MVGVSPTAAGIAIAKGNWKSLKQTSYLKLTWGRSGSDQIPFPKPG